MSSNEYVVIPLGKDCSRTLLDVKVGTFNSPRLHYFGCNIHIMNGLRELEQAFPQGGW